MTISEREAEELDIEGAALDAGDEGYSEDGVGFALPETLDEQQLLEALYKDLRRGEHAREVQAEAEMRRVIEASKTLGEPGFGLVGQLQARIPKSVFMHWGLRYGFEIWNDPKDLVRFLDRKNPGFWIKSHGRTIGHGHGLPPRDAVKPSELKYLLPATERAGSCGESDGAAAGTTPAAVSLR